jgi:hypothetical protein
MVSTHNCRSGATKIHVPLLNMFVTAQSFALSAKNVPPILLHENVYLDMFQQFPIPQLDDDDREGSIQFQQDGSSLMPWRSAQVPQHPFPRSVDW